MNSRKFKKALCALLICSQVFIGGLVVYANNDSSNCNEVSPRNIAPPRPI